MNREIIFRQWDKEYVEFRYWRFVIHKISELFPVDDIFTPPIIGIPLEQYTGLNDHKGVRIFEGDIVKVCELEDVVFDEWNNRKEA